MVYSILYTDRTTQFVQVFSNYDPSGFDPYQNTVDPAVKGASITLSSSGGSVVFRDTTLPRSDTSRYTDQINAYYENSLTIDRSKSYTLVVQSPTVGSVRATCVVPNFAYVSLVDGLQFFNGSAGTDKQVIRIQITTQGGAKGVWLRLFIEYEVLQDTVWIPKRMEVPLSYIKGVTPSLDAAFYPSLQRIDGPIFIQAWSGAAFNAVRDYLFNSYPSSQLRLRRARFISTLVDDNIYNYYKVVNGFEDQLSIRTDRPDYTNIVGGAGIFGVCAVDTLSYGL